MYNVDRVYQRNCLCYKSVVSLWYRISLWFAAKTKLQLISLDSVVSRNQIHPLNINKSVTLHSCDIEPITFLYTSHMISFST